VRGLARGERGAVSVALVGTLASTRFAGMLRQFGQRHPSVKLELRTANSQEVSDLVRRGEATLGLRYFTDTDPGLVSEQVTEEALVLACSPDHRLAGRRVREPGALAGERWVAFPPPAPAARALRHGARAAARRGRHRNTDSNPDLEPELEGPVRLQVVAGPRNH
jgi:DNA-binding transcriptional LysR family regulator